MGGHRRKQAVHLATTVHEALALIELQAPPFGRKILRRLVAEYILHYDKFKV